MVDVMTLPCWFSLQTMSGVEGGRSFGFKAPAVRFRFLAC